MTEWRPITFAEPAGEGTVLLWCGRTDWIRTASAFGLAEDFDGTFLEIDGYHYTHYAYIDHPYPVPEHHPYYDLIILQALSEDDHVTLAKTIGERAETYEEFVRGEHARYYCGQSNAKMKWMPTNNYHLIFKSDDERLLAEITLGYKNAR